jgi:hypothetical protein
MASDIIHAPFTDEQVEALNRFQARPDAHPFTCGNDARRHDRQVNLVATNEGWVCSDSGCSYTQNWAHAATAS